ncbi:MAG: ECF-type sigma factor [Pseudomonadota bacterium]
MSTPQATDAEPSKDPAEVAQLLTGLRALQLQTTGSPQQAQALLYDDLKRLARRISGEFHSGETLRTTALLHEAYARLAGGKPPDLKDRREALALMATVMRRVAVDHIRARTAAKRGGELKRVPLEEAAALSQSGSPDELILGLDHALEQLNTFAPELARLVELLFFVGLSQAEVAELEATSERSVRRNWRKARAWLHRLMSGSDGDEPG